MICFFSGDGRSVLPYSDLLDKANNNITLLYLQTASCNTYRRTSTNQSWHGETERRSGGGEKTVWTAEDGSSGRSRSFKRGPEGNRQNKLLLSSCAKTRQKTIFILVTGGPWKRGLRGSGYPPTESDGAEALGCAGHGCRCWRRSGSGWFHARDGMRSETYKISKY